MAFGAATPSQVTFDPSSALTWVAIVEVVLVVGLVALVPQLSVRVVVVLHQHAEEDDEDDLQDQADRRQLYPHVGGRAGHVGYGYGTVAVGNFFF